MKITIYELLGMIKDGKAPKKIKFNNIYCYYRECKNEYVDYTNKPIIQWDYVVMNSLNDEVEILEEEKKIPERVPNAEVFNVPKLNKMEVSNIVLRNKIDIKIIKDTLNEVLDYLKSKGE